MTTVRLQCAWARLFLPVLLLLLSSVTFGADWKLEKTHKDPVIKVYTRAVPGSAIREFKGETVVTSSLGGLVALLKDTPNLPNWIYAMISIELLDRPGSHESITHSLSKIGPFMSNRDTIVHSLVAQDSKTDVVTITLSGRPDYLPVADGVVRVSHLRGEWRFIAIGNGSVRVIYQVHADPAGQLPRRLVNAFLVKSPLKTLIQMHIQINNYRDLRLTGIREPNQPDHAGAKTTADAYAEHGESSGVVQ